MQKKPLKNPKFIGCRTCGSVPLDILSDSNTFYPGSVHILNIVIDNKNHALRNEDGITLKDIESNYKEELKECKFAELRHVTPLHNETWEFNTEDRKWYLVEQGYGYA